MRGGVDWRVVLGEGRDGVRWGRGVRGRGARSVRERVMRMWFGVRRRAVRELLEWGLRVGVRGEVRGEAEVLGTRAMRLAEWGVLVLRELEWGGLLGLERCCCGVRRVRGMRRGGAGSVCG